MGLIWIVTLVVLKATRHDASALPSKEESIVKEIESLQKTIDDHPRDSRSLLRLGNLYYDLKMFPRAVMMYDRLLEIQPSNADARVDLGTSYFEMGLTDSTHRAEYLETAGKEIRQALTYSPKHQLAHYNLGMVSLHSGDIEEAKEWFRKCVEIDPR